MQQQFSIGQKVKAIAFTNCFGEQVPERLNLIVTDVRLIWRLVSMAPYYRVEAHEIGNEAHYVEGAERYFAAV